MKQVTKSEFYVFMNPINVHPWPDRDNPHKATWKDPQGRVFGKSESNALTAIQTKYYIKS